MEDNRKQNVEVVTIAGPGPLGLKLVAFNSQGEEENLNAKVASVKPNSNAYKARVFPGALIFAVNGVSVEGLRYNEVLTKIKQASQSRPFDLTLKKPNKLIEFSRKIEEGKNLRKAGNNLNNNNHHNIDGKNIITSSTKSKDPIETNKKVSNPIEPSPSSSPALNISPEISNNKKTVPTSINDTTFNNNNNNMEQHNKINITTTNKNGINQKTQSSSSEDVSKLNTTIQSLNNQIKSLNLQLDNQTNATTNLSKKFIKEKRQLEESNKLLNENLTQINTHNESLKVQVEKDSQTLINKQNETNMLQEEVSKLKATITDIESSKNKEVLSPLSLNISAFAPIKDVRLAATPVLDTDCFDSTILLIDLGLNKNRLGGSIYMQVHSEIGSVAPDVDDPKLLTSFFDLMKKYHASKTILSYHDRSDGGAFVSLVEMGFASNTGISISVESDDVASFLFNEELGNSYLCTLSL